jgi:hypothetical protein
MDENLYLTPEEALEELRKRQENKELQRAVEEYLGTIPEPFQNGPRSVLFRNIISPTTEFLHFLQKSYELELNPVGIEHTRDKFSTRNQDKMMLAKLLLLQGKDKHGNPIVHKKNIIDIKLNDNKTFREILTLGNESLPHFHHCLLRSYLTETPDLYDLSDWLLNDSVDAQEYYKKFLALFITHGILFETFVTNDSEAQFATSVVIPAFESISTHFGLKPLIIKNTSGVDNLQYWTSFPGDVLDRKIY